MSTDGVDDGFVPFQTEDMEFLGEHACEEWLKDNPKLRNW